MRITEGELDIPVSLIEAKTSTEACDYLAEHYSELVKIVAKCGVHPSRCEDLIHDVWISLATNELDGEGFDMNYANTKSNNQILDVSQFVIGRIKLYAKNTRYKTDVSETSTTVVYQNNDNGSKFIKNRITTKTVAASFDDSDLDSNDSFQKGYAMASITDSTDDLVESYSLREQIDYCIDICETSGLNIINLFKNIDTLSELLGVQSRKKKSETVFNSITELVEKHNDFAEALLDVLKFSARNRAAFDLVLKTY